jgi:hypothetical protein
MPEAERLTATLAGVALGAAAASAACSWRPRQAPAAATPVNAEQFRPGEAEPRAELAAAYRRDGFVKLPGLLGPAEVGEWRAAVAAGCERQLARSGGKYHKADEEVDVAGGDYANQGEDAGHYRMVFVQCVNMCAVGLAGQRWARGSFTPSVHLPFGVDTAEATSLPSHVPPAATTSLAAGQLRIWGANRRAAGPRRHIARRWKKDPAIRALLFEQLAPRLRALLPALTGAPRHRLYHDHCLVKQVRGSRRPARRGRGRLYAAIVCSGCSSLPEAKRSLGSCAAERARALAAAAAVGLADELAHRPADGPLLGRRRHHGLDLAGRRHRPERRLVLPSGHAEAGKLKHRARLPFFVKTQPNQRLPLCDLAGIMA